MILLVVKLIGVSILALFINQEQPVFDNGNESLTQYLASNMIYPTYAKQNCIQGTIKVSFQLNTQGVLFNAKIVKGLGIDLDDEALRLIKLTNHKWSIPKNHKENTEIIIPVVFSLENYDCENISKREINKAVDLYQTRQALEDVVTNYYKKKVSGAVNTKNEQQIIQLKADLGFDEELVLEKLEEAKKMLKQGDKEGACKTLMFIRNIGFSNADDLIAENCK
ncbi:MAG TPA: energy transducer TonB [Pelobium sp.]|nr:energy transducer TonB [Pelobium sp.]